MSEEKTMGESGNGNVERVEGGGERGDVRGWEEKGFHLRGERLE